MEYAHEVITTNHDRLDPGVVESFGDPGATFTSGLKRPPPNVPTRMQPGNLAFGISGQNAQFEGVGHTVAPHPDVKCVTFGQVFRTGDFRREASATVEFVMAVRIC